MLEIDTNDIKPNISYENIQEDEYEEITNLENSSIVEEDLIHNVQEINDEPKNFDKSEFISPSLEVKGKNIRKAKKKDVSITAIKIENQKKNLQKLNYFLK